MSDSVPTPAAIPIRFPSNVRVFPPPSVVLSAKNCFLMIVFFPSPFKANPFGITIDSV